MFLSNLIAGLIGLLLFAGFLIYLISYMRTPAVPFVIVVVAVVGLLLWDMVHYLREIWLKDRAKNSG
ncbi:MAG: hypothetical protein FJX46_05995 [Alphaproteobacteria bacterium]|nr:hypothetical protein [Alphaproteobacteria bacterium]